jgi:hypothetical protein
MNDDDAFTVGYQEDGVMRVGGVPEAAAAERLAKEWWGEWRVVAEVYICPEGRYTREGEFVPLGGGDEAWVECEAGAPLAERVWRLVDVSRPTLLDEEENEYVNPHFRPERSSGSD